MLGQAGRAGRASDGAQSRDGQMKEYRGRKERSTWPRLLGSPCNSIPGKLLTSPLPSPSFPTPVLLCPSDSRMPAIRSDPSSLSSPSLHSCPSPNRRPSTQTLGPALPGSCLCLGILPEVMLCKACPDSAPSPSGWCPPGLLPFPVHELTPPCPSLTLSLRITTALCRLSPCPRLGTHRRFCLMAGFLPAPPTELSL